MGHCSPRVDTAPAETRRFNGRCPSKPCDPRLGPTSPRPSGPSCRPMLSPPASSAFAPTCPRARFPARLRPVLSLARQTWPRGSGEICRAVPSSRFAPVSACLRSSAVGARGPTGPQGPALDGSPASTGRRSRRPLHGSDRCRACRAGAERRHFPSLQRKSAARESGPRPSRDRSDPDTRRSCRKRGPAGDLRPRGQWRRGARYCPSLWER